MLMNKKRPDGIVIEKQQGMKVLMPIYPRLCWLRTDSLYVLMSCLTHALHLVGQISHSDREAE